MTSEATMTIDERGYMDVGGVALRIHRNTIHQATMIGETGDSYSLIEWDHAGNTDRIYGESAPASRVLELAPGVEAYRTNYGDLGFRIGEQTELAEEMLDNRGYTIYPAFGATRKPGDEDVTCASEILDALGEFWGEE